MTVVSSVFTQEHAQRDGRRWIAETHTDHLAVKHVVRWLAAAGLDYAAIAAARAAQIEASLRTGEIEENIISILRDGRLAAISFVHSTIAANRSALRDAYTKATRVEAIMIGDFLGSLTDAQLQSLFSMTGGQVTTLRTSKLTPAATAATTIRATTGA